MKDIIFVDEEDFIKYFLDNSYDESLFKSDRSLNKNYNSFKKTCLIATIFVDWWLLFIKNIKT